MSDERSQKLYPWQEGLPVKPDVDQLLRAWPDLQLRDRIEYSAVEHVLNLNRSNPRFRTITTQWRKRLLEGGIVIECDANTAFFVATAEQVAAATYTQLRFVGRKMKRHRVKLLVSKPTDDAQRSVLEHQARLLHGIHRDLKKARMNVLPTLTATPHPRVGPPRLSHATSANDAAERDTGEAT